MKNWRSSEALVYNKMRWAGLQDVFRVEKRAVSWNQHIFIGEVGTQHC